MSNKPKLRFKEFNDEWKEYSMDSCGSFLKGNYLSKADLTNTGYPCLLYGELYTKYSEITTNILSCTNRLESNQAVGMINDVLLPSSGETAIDISTATCLQVDNVLLGGDLNIFRPNKQDGRFISYELNHKKRKKIACIAQGATVVHLYPNYLKKVKLSLPSINEQSKIAEFLSKVDEVISEREEEVKDLEQQKKGLMQKIFSQQIRFTDSNNTTYPDWEEKILYDITDVRDGTHDSPKYVSFGYPLVTSKNLTKDGKLDFTDISYITENDYNEINKRSKVHIGDILFGMIGTIGKPVVIQQDNFAIKNVALIKNNNDNINRYLVHYLQSDDILRQFHVEIAGGTQKFIALGLIRNLKILLPCLEEQQKIANVLSKLDELIEEKKALLSDWQSFKKGLLQQMFV